MLRKCYESLRPETCNIWKFFLIPNCRSICNFLIQQLSRSSVISLYLNAHGEVQVDTISLICQNNLTHQKPTVTNTTVGHSVWLILLPPYSWLQMLHLFSLLLHASLIISFVSCSLNCCVPVILKLGFTPKFMTLSPPLVMSTCRSPLYCVACHIQSCTSVSVMFFTFCVSYHLPLCYDLFNSV